MSRRCGNCGGPVYLSFSISSFVHPISGAEVSIRGLGTWKCSRNCSPRGRIVTVTRFIGCGKESDRGSTVRGHNAIHQMDVADDCIRQMEHVRPIAIITTLRGTK